VPDRKLPQELIDFWPEVFEDLEIDVVPVEYLHSIIVEFDDGISWNIDLTEQAKEADLEGAITDLVDEYQQEIVNIDFRLDIERVKKDVSKRTNHFLKKKR